MENNKVQVQEAVVEKQKINIGKNGKKFIEGFGFAFETFRNEENNRKLVEEYMLENYPNKIDSIVKWLDWYKGYFNMGRIKGYETPDKIKWNKVQG